MKDKRILILFLTIFIDLLGFGVVIPILPNLAKSLATGSTLPFNPDVAVGVVVGSFSIIQFLFAPIFGSLSDRIGRRPILLVSILFNIVGYILFGLSSSFVFLLLARVVSGTVMIGVRISSILAGLLNNADEWQYPVISSIFSL